MKGLIFTEFMDMVESHWGIAMLDDLIASTQPASGGAYTSVENYAFAELEAYLDELHDITGIELNNLLIQFGSYMAESFVNKFPEYFKGAASTFDVLKRVDDHIHVEVTRLHPDAVLPSFSYNMDDENTMTLRYESVRSLADLVEGIVMKCGEIFGENLSMSRTVISEDSPTIVEFSIRKH